MIAHTKIIILDSFDRVLIKACIRQVIYNDRGTLHGSFQVFNARSGKIRCRNLRFLADHHFEQCFQKAGLPGLALSINQAKYRIRQTLLIESRRHIAHRCHQR